MTTKRLRGISREMFLRLCTRAPFIRMWVCALALVSVIVQDASNEISCKDTKQNPFVKVPAFTAKSIILKQNLFLLTFFYLFVRSEERRVGKECRSRWS